jgi:hypothetical protein
MPKLPHHTPILPPNLTLLLQKLAKRNERKETELEKKSCKESVSIGTSHALKIIGESTRVHPVCPLCERQGEPVSPDESRLHLSKAL